MLFTALAKARDNRYEPHNTTRFRRLVPMETDGTVTTVMTLSELFGALGTGAVETIQDFSVDIVSNRVCYQNKVFFLLLERLGHCRIHQCGSSNQQGHVDELHFR